MNARVSNNTRIVVAGAAILVVAGVAYGVGRVYPPQGASLSGTIQP